MHARRRLGGLGLPTPLISSEAHRGHAPWLQMIDGRTAPHPEVPDRPAIIRAALQDAGLIDPLPPEPHDDDAIVAVHARAYLSFLRETADQVRPGEQISPIPASRDPAVPESSSLAVRAGLFAFGSDAPLMRGTYAAARSAVDVALTAAGHIAAGRRVAIGLCRPPGHHAEHSRMGGFCYLNNAMIAAHLLSNDGPVAVIDIDYHHGNGTQHLAYERADVLYVSLHADPRFAYPGFSGRADERGSGDGEGYNHNFPLPPRTTIEPYLTAMDRACAIISDYAPSSLIVSIGFDTHEADPIATFGLHSDDFGRIGERIRGLDLPTLHVLEGGYALDVIGPSAVAYFGAFA